MTIPLTLHHGKEDSHLFTMPETQLLSALKTEFDLLLEEELKVVDDWIRNKLCGCSENPDIQQKRISLKCKHIKKAKSQNKLIKQCEKRIGKMSSALTLRKLAEFKLKTSNADKPSEESNED